MDTFVNFLSGLFIPLLVFYIVGFGLLMKCPVFDAFTDGAKDGFHVAVSILPTLIGLIAGVRVLRASGFLDWLAGLLPRGVLPVPLVPVILMRPFSSSAATGLALDIFKEYGPDSYLGRAASILLSCTETVFYTMSLYFVTVKVTKTRWTMAGAMLATAAGVAASLWLA